MDFLVVPACPDLEENTVDGRWGHIHCSFHSWGNIHCSLLWLGDHQMSLHLVQLHEDVPEDWPCAPVLDSVQGLDCARMNSERMNYCLCLEAKGGSMPAQLSNDLQRALARA